MTSFLATPRGYRIAYHRLEGASPGIVFMGGFRSDMTGAKALALETFCRARGQAFLRFDYSGHGEADGKFEECTIGQWKEDALSVLDTVTDGPQILVGSSMGGWIMLLAALARPERVAGLVGVAAAPDFTESLIWQTLKAKEQKALLKKGRMEVPDCYGTEPYVITLQLIEEARRHLLMGQKKIAIRCPVRLLHGMLDEDVPWQFSMALNEKLETEDVKLNLIMDGNHRLSEPKHLAILGRTVEKLLDSLSSSSQ